MFLFLIWSRNYETGESSFVNVLGKGREIEDKRVNFKNRRIDLPETKWKGMEGTSYWVQTENESCSSPVTQIPVLFPT